MMLWLTGTYDFDQSTTPDVVRISKLSNILRSLGRRNGEGEKRFANRRSEFVHVAPALREHGPSIFLRQLATCETTSNSLTYHHVLRTRTSTSITAADLHLQCLASNALEYAAWLRPTTSALTSSPPPRPPTCFYRPSAPVSTSSIAAELQQ